MHRLCPQLTQRKLCHPPSLLWKYCRYIRKICGSHAWADSPVGSFFRHLSGSIFIAVGLSGHRGVVVVLLLALMLVGRRAAALVLALRAAAMLTL